EHAAGDGRPAPHVGEIGSDHPGRHALDHVTPDARRPRVNGLALLRATRLRRLGRSAFLLRHPRLEAGPRLHDHAQAHVGVRGAAELGTLAGVVAHRVGAERDAVDVAGDRVALAAQRGGPEGVNYVGRGYRNMYGVFNREVTDDGREPAALVSLRHSAQ